MTCFTEVCASEGDGDQATARCCCRETLLLRGGGLRRVIGRYENALMRENGTWLLSRRSYELFLDEGTTGTA